MDNVLLANATRNIGVSQGYANLSIIDVKVPVTVVQPDGSTQSAEAPAQITMWQPSPEELAALVAGGLVMVSVLGHVHPPITVNAYLEPAPPTDAVN